MLHHRLRHLVGHFVGPAVRPLYAWLRRRRYLQALQRGEAAGELVYVWSDHPPPPGQVVEVRWPAKFAPAEAAALCEGQSLHEVRGVGLDEQGVERWRVSGRGGHATTTAEASWFYAPGTVVDTVADTAVDGFPEPTFLETAMLLLAAEDVDALTLLPEPQGAVPQPTEIEDLQRPPWRLHTLFRTAAYSYDPATDSVRPRPGNRQAKVVPPCDPAREVRFWGAKRRGPFLANHALPPRLEITVRDASGLCRRPPPPTEVPAKPAVLVLAPFLARGGAEQTLFETLRALSTRFEFTFVTLAPHLPTRGDRRDDFRQISPRLFSLGDQVHPAAMVGILHALLDATGAEILYNANGTTLFYDFAPQLKARRPGLRILDHLYDHRVGYIERHDRHLLSSVDLCVAENHRIREVLTEERGWPAERVPVIWPCGRADDAMPTGEDAVKTRRALRRELGLQEDDLVLLTAARMHPQKRPLDLVRLADRLRDLKQVHFLLVGGGELEEQVDASIAAVPGARVRRLAFRADIPQLLSASDIGCLVSDYEGLPVFLLECLQAGRPFLGTDVGDLGRVLHQTGAGLVVDRPGDLDALEQAVRQLTDPSRRAALALKARAAAPAFGVEACAERYARVFLGETDLPPYPSAEGEPR